MKYKLVWLLLSAIWICNSCNDEDDIKAIFVGKTWKLSNYYTTTNWKDDDDRKPVYTFPEGKDALEAINTAGKYVITFSEKTFAAQGGDNNFSGTWEADGKKNTLVFHITSSTSPSSKLSKDFFEAVKNAGYYRGDANIIKIYAEDQKSYMQFYSLN